jgi:uncharacterized protein
MSDTNAPNDNAGVANLWDVVSRSLHSRGGGMWILVGSTDPGMAMLMRTGPDQGSMSCHYSPRTESLEGQASVRLYLDSISLRRLRDFRSTNPTIELPPTVAALQLIAAEDPGFDSGPYHVQGSWEGMGMLCSLATIVSPDGPELYSRLGPWYVDSLEAIWNHMGDAMRWSRAQETKRVEELRSKAEAGDRESQHSLGNLLLSSSSLLYDAYEGVRWTRQAAEAGLAAAQHSLGHCFARGHGEEEDMEEAAKWWRKAAEQSHVPAAYHLGSYLQSKEEPDLQEALRWLKYAADEGLAEAQHELGELILSEEWSDQNKESGIAYLEKSAKAGLISAMESLAMLFWRGEIVPKDASRSFKWLLRACEAGSQHFTCELGERYERGEGVGQSYADAAKWYRKAMKDRNRRATMRLGNLHFHGYGVPRSLRHAIQLWNHGKGMLGIGEPPCRFLKLEVRNGHLLAVDEDGKRRIVDTGCRSSGSLETVDAHIPGTAAHLRSILGEDVAGIIGNDLLLSGSGLVIDLSERDKGMLWIPNPGSSGSNTRLIKVDIEIDGLATSALIDTGAQYSYIRRPLTGTSPTTTARDFSVYTGKLEHFDIELHALPVRVGDWGAIVRFGNLPPSMAEKAYQRAGVDAVVGPELFAGACLAWNRDMNDLEIASFT